MLAATPDWLTRRIKGRGMKGRQARSFFIPHPVYSYPAELGDRPGALGRDGVEPVERPQRVPGDGAAAEDHPAVHVPPPPQVEVRDELAGNGDDDGESNPRLLPQARRFVAPDGASTNRM
jgi:hypothetical protein